MEQLRESLRLPGVGGELVAYRNPANRVFGGLSEPWYSWRLVYAISGPDDRYNPGIAILDEEAFLAFRQAVETAVTKMKVLREHSLSGSYTNRLTSHVEITAEKGGVMLKLVASSGTHSFHKLLGPNQASELLGMLQELPERGERLARALKALG